MPVTYVANGAIVLSVAKVFYSRLVCITLFTEIHMGKNSYAQDQPWQSHPYSSPSRD